MPEIVTNRKLVSDLIRGFERVGAIKTDSGNEEQARLFMVPDDGLKGYYQGLIERACNWQGLDDDEIISQLDAPEMEAHRFLTTELFR